MFSLSKKVSKTKNSNACKLFDNSKNCKQRLFNKFEMSERQKSEEIALLSKIVNQREDIQTLNNYIEENKMLKNQINKHNVKYAQMKKIIEDYKSKGFDY